MIEALVHFIIYKSIQRSHLFMISVITLTDRIFKVSLKSRFFASVPPQLIKRGNCPGVACGCGFVSKK